jgi:alanyl-tRNA synthetase
MLARLDDIVGTGRDIGAFRLWTFTAPEGVAANDLRDLVQRAKAMARTELPVCVVGMAVHDGKVSAVAAVNDASVRAGATARDLLAAAAPAIDGRGGGKDLLAQGGGSNPAGIATAFEAVAARLRTTGA